MCNDIAIIEYGRRTSGLPNAPVAMEHDKNRIAESTAIDLNIKNNPNILTYRQGGDSLLLDLHLRV